ncbi:DUF1573 domain-containing protein [Blastomonas sp. UPD001]|jgi:hypothetical protein|uniref:Ig-like domain-containing protein n=1 Tax=Blastomonas sp. UPD001 TaxID=2217673 RepID=UPI000E351501|nr:DUF1573 domain-containing protein [Blastomonas sp. UPD001]
MTIRPPARPVRHPAVRSGPRGIRPRPAPANKPIIAFEKQVFDLGKVSVGARVEGAFAVSNPGNRSLEITEVSSDCQPCVDLYDKLDEPMVVYPGTPEEIRFLLQGTKTPGPSTSRCRSSATQPSSPERR